MNLSELLLNNSASWHSFLVATLVCYGLIESAGRIRVAGGGIRIAWAASAALLSGSVVWFLQLYILVTFSGKELLSFRADDLLLSFVAAMPTGLVGILFLRLSPRRKPWLLLASLLIPIFLVLSHIFCLYTLHHPEVELVVNYQSFLYTGLASWIIFCAVGAGSFLVPFGRFASFTRAVVGGAIVWISIVLFTVTGHDFKPATDPIAEDLVNVEFLYFAGFACIAFLVTQSLFAYLDRVLGISDTEANMKALVVGALLTVLVLDAVAYAIVKDLREERRVEIKQALETVLATTDQGFRSWRAQHLHFVSYWAQSEFIKTQVGKIARFQPEHAWEATQQKDLRLWFDSLQASFDYAGYLVVSPDGINLSANDREIIGTTSRLVYEDEFFERLLELEVVLSLPINLNEPGVADTSRGQESVMYLAAPITNDWNELIAILAFSIDPVRDYSTVLKRGRLGESGETYTVDAQGLLVSESRYFRELHEQGLLEQGVPAMLNLEVRKPAIGGVKGELTHAVADATRYRSGTNVQGYWDYRGIPVVGTWLADHASGMGMIVEQSLSEAMRPYRSGRDSILALTSLVTPLIFVVVILTVIGRTKLIRSNEQTRVMSAKQKDIDQELAIAGEIQLNMVPQVFPPFPERREIDIFAQLNPAKEVGGDFYDFFLLDDDRVCFCIGDVAGKGVPAALFMAMARTLIKSRAASDHSVSSIVSHVNHELVKGNESNMFVTLIVALVDTQTGAVEYCNAGHNQPYVLCSDGTVNRIAGRHGPAVGVIADIDYSSDTILMHQGDLFFAYTDGVTEAMDVDRNVFGESRLETVLSSVVSASAEITVDTVVSEVDLYETGSAQFDDVTALAFKLLPQQDSKLNMAV